MRSYLRCIRLPPGTRRTEHAADLLVQVVGMNRGELARDGPRDAKVLEVRLQPEH